MRVNDSANRPKSKVILGQRYLKTSIQAKTTKILSLV